MKTFFIEKLKMFVPESNIRKATVKDLLDSGKCLEDCDCLKLETNNWTVNQHESEMNYESMINCETEYLYVDYIKDNEWEHDILTKFDLTEVNLNENYQG